MMAKPIAARKHNIFNELSTDRIRPSNGGLRHHTLQVLIRSQLLIKTNDLLDFLRAFWDKKVSPTEMHHEDCRWAEQYRLSTTRSDV
jgi:hypothetical protein